MYSNCLVSIDMSLRSTGVVVMNSKDEIKSCHIIKTFNRKPEDDYELIIDHEDTINMVVDEIMKIIDSVDTRRVVIEGLSHQGKSSMKDVIAGLFWCIRTKIRYEYPYILIGAIPVLSWRSKVLNPKEVGEAKQKFSPKNFAIKQATINKLPKKIRVQFENYINENELPKKSLADLTDSYFMGIYRNKLDRKSGLIK